MTYVAGHGDEHAEIMLVGEAIGPDEEQAGQAFVGFSGKELMKMLTECGINPSQCWFTNVIRNRPPTFNGKLDLSGWISPLKKHAEGKTFFFGNYVSDKFLEHLNDLRREIEIIKPKLIIALGAVALTALTGKSGITNWRGSELWLDLPDCQHKCHVVPTFNPAFIYGNWPARRLIKRDITRGKECLKIEGRYEPKWAFILRPSFAQCTEFLDKTLRELQAGPKLLAVDIETRRGQIACVGLAPSKEFAICIPILDAKNPRGYWSQDEEFLLVDKLRDVLTHPHARIVGHNFHYDDSYFAKCWGFRCNVAHDTMIEWHVLFARWEKSLSFVCSILCERYIYWKDDGKEWDYSVPEEQYWAYNCTDCVRDYEIHELIQATGAKMDLLKQMEFEMSLYSPVMKMMMRGVRQDMVKKREISKELGEEIKKRLDWLEAEVGFPLNPNSTPQMQTFFYDDMRQKKIYHRKTGQLTLDDAALDKIYKREPLLRGILQVVSQIRSLKVFKSTFADATVDPDERIRTHFWIPGTANYRFSSKKDPFGSGANLQNIPEGNETAIMEVLKKRGNLSLEELAATTGTSHDELMSALVSADPTRKGLVDSGFVALAGEQVSLLFSLPNIRKLFIPDAGKTWIKSDLKGADFQVMIWEANAEILKQMLRAGLDVHTELSKITKLKRQDSKILIHGTDYGASYTRLAEILNIPVHAAERAQRAYFDFVPGVVDYQKRVISDVKSQGFVQNKFGFRCYFFDRPDDIIPEALAWIPASTVAIAINAGIVEVDKHLPEFELLLQVHDEADFQIADDLLPTMMPQLDKHMRVTIPYDDPLIIPLEYATSKKSWGELQKYPTK